MSDTMSNISFLKQFINLSAIKQLHRVFLHPSLLVPTIHVNSINDIDITSLKHDHQVKFIVFDKDNTLSYAYDDHIHPSLVNKVNEIKQQFHPQHIAIISNSVGTNDDYQHQGARKTEESMKIPVIRHSHKKPDCIDEVINHFQSYSNDIVSKEQICVIGQ